MIKYNSLCIKLNFKLANVLVLVKTNLRDSQTLGKKRELSKANKCIFWCSMYSSYSSCTQLSINKIFLLLLFSFFILWALFRVNKNDPITNNEGERMSVMLDWYQVVKTYYIIKEEHDLFRNELGASRHLEVIWVLYIVYPCRVPIKHVLITQSVNVWVILRSNDFCPPRNNLQLENVNDNYCNPTNFSFKTNYTSISHSHNIKGVTT